VQGQRQFVSDRDHTARKSEPLTLSRRSRLAKADPGNAGWQRDLALSYDPLAKVHAQQGSRADAISLFQQGHEIISWLAQQSPDNVTFRNDLAWFEQEIAAQK